MENPIKGDWVEQVEKDMVEVQLDIQMDDIRIMSKPTFQLKVKTAVHKAAFNYLCSEN